MRAVYIERSGGFDVLRVREVPEPVPRPGEVAIRVRAAGINFADVLARQGIYPGTPPYPCVVGYEASGTVVAVGAGVPADWVGKDVLALTDFGGYAEVCCVSAAYVWEKPPRLGFDEAAAIPLNYITAWALLMAMGSLQRGETVLVHNAGGGVGLAAIDIAKWRGAFVIGAASGRKHDFLRRRGCDHCVDYTRANWPAEVMRITEQRGVELALDPIGGAHWRKSYGVLRRTGRLGMYGISDAAVGGWRAKLALGRLALRTPLFHPLRLVPGNRGVFGVNIHRMYDESDKLRSWMASILAGVADGWVRPHVDRSFPFEEAGSAHEYIERRGNIGKVLLKP